MDTDERLKRLTASDGGDDPASPKCLRPEHLSPLFPAGLRGTVPERLEAVIARCADSLALADGETRLTFGQLGAAAEGIAQALAATLGEENEPVALCLQGGTATLAAVFGALAAGKTYVPIDPALPDDRKRVMLEQIRPRAAVCDAAGAEWARRLADGAQVILVDECAGLRLARRPDIRPETPAVVLFTSGSTGEPKGVAVSHETLLHDVRSVADLYGIGPADRVGVLTALSAPITLSRTFGAMLNGAAALIYDPRQRGLAGLAGWMRAEGITYTHMTPTMFRNWAAMLRDGEEFPALRLLGLGSETILPSDIELYRRRLPDHCRIRLGMGISEVGGMVSCLIADKSLRVAWAQVPLGYPGDDVAVEIRREDGSAAAPGEIGEIIVKSRYLSLGYWRRPDLTAAVFEQDPSDPRLRAYRTGDLGRMSAAGCLYHMGRKDAQLKVRGMKANPHVVESALLAMPGVREAAVVGIEEPGGGTTLVAYLATGDAPPTVSQARAWLAGRVAEHMLPSKYVFLDLLPQTATGKVDRRRLPTPDAARPALDVAYQAPRTPVERVLAQAWAEALGLEQVGIHDHFMDLGGHSLKAARILARAQQALQVEITPAEFFARPTIAEQALLLTERLLEEIQAGGSGDEDV